MADGGALFALVAERPPAGDACARPIGGRRPPRPQPALRRYPPPSATLALLGQLRAQLGDGLTSLRQQLDRIDRSVAGQAAAIAGLAEAVDQLRQRLVAIERVIGVCEPPSAPRPSRRSPCA